MRTLKNNGHSNASVVTVKRWTDELIVVKSVRKMHLNPPLTDERVVTRKMVSWWNVAAAETRSECINEMERKLERPLTIGEYGRMVTTILNDEEGIETVISVTFHG